MTMILLDLDHISKDKLHCNLNNLIRTQNIKKHKSVAFTLLMTIRS